MEFEKIEIYENKYRLYINDPIRQVSLVLEVDQGEFFNKLAMAYFSAQAKKLIPASISD